MQQINQLNSFSFSNCWNVKYSLKRWCLDYIEKKNCRLTYEEMMDLDFVMEAENSCGKEVVFNQKQIDHLIKKYYRKNVIGGTKEKIAEIVLGLPCSGKSTYLENKNYIICDSDLIKELIPEYDGGRGNERCHRASKIIFRELLRDLANDGYSLGIPIIGKTIKSFNEIYDILVNNGYKIVVKYLKISKIEALNRALVRFIKSGRYVSLDYINRIDEYDIEYVYNEITNYSEIIDSSKDYIDSNYNFAYSVEAKCGHVGIKNYIPVEFAVYKENKKQAASDVRFFPRVKHDHKDAIINVKPIGFMNALNLQYENDHNPYLKCTNRRQQDTIQFDLDIREEVIEEKNKKYDVEKRKKVNIYKEQSVLEELRNYKRFGNDYYLYD